MRFREVFRYEFTHRLRSPSTWVYAAILLVMAFSVNLDDAPVAAAVHANAPARVAVIALLMGMFALPVSAAIFGDAAVRDVRAGMDPLLFTSPIRKADYLGGRFLAALAINAIVLLAIPLGVALPVLIGNVGPVAFGPFHVDPAAFGPFRLSAYGQPYLLLLLPNLVLIGAVLFATGVLTRQSIPVYLATIGLFIGTMISALASEESVSSVASVLGPLGFAGLNELVEYWTPAEQNARLIGYPATLVWNRAVWLITSATLLAGLHWRFRFKHPDGGGRRRAKRRRPVGELQSERARPLEIPRVAGTSGARTAALQTLAIARHSLAEIVASRWFAVVLLACVFLTMLWGWNVGDTVFDTSTWPVTLLVAGTVLSERIVLLIYLLIILYAGELVWRQREVGTAEIADAAPVPDGVALLGRFLALVAVLVMMLAAAMVGGILIQAFQGYFDFEIGLYLRVVFGLNLANYGLLAALAMTIHVLVNQKYLGHFIALLAIVLTRLAGSLGVRHHLLVYGTDPGWTYSDMNGFGPFVEPFVWFKLYWAAWALLLAVVAVLFVVRGSESGMRHRIRQARARFIGPVVRTAGVAFVMVVLFGGFIFYNTNILNEYRTTDESGVTQADYEKRYRRFDDLSQPEIARAELRIEIYPDEPSVDLGGRYGMVNRTGAAIDSVHVFTVPDVRVDSISFDRAARPVVVDEEAGYRIYALERTLEPGDSLQLTFDVTFRPRGFPNSGIQTSVVANGTYFNRIWLPFIGYQPAFELADAEARRRFGLEPQPRLPSPGDSQAEPYRQEIRDADRVHVEAVIGTAAGQTAVTPGVLRSSWTENGRQYFHYETETPVEFGNAVFSARYAVLDDRWNDVALRLYHHPTHDYDLDRMVAGMKASLDYYTANYGPYESSLLSIVEVPRYDSGGHAHPHTIAFSEDMSISRVRDGQVDQPFYGTAHEVAHMWWGGQVSGAPARGRAFLSESLANYSAMLVVENTAGAGMARRVYDFQMDRYLRGRSVFSREVPLLEVEDQPYIAYRKGAVAMYTLREHIGEEAVNTALRRYLEKYRYPASPRPTSLDLYAELRAVTPDSLKYVLTDWFETITLWDLRTEQALVEPTAAGEYRVTLQVVARKVRSDGVGNETEVPMDEPVEIGVFEQGGDDRFSETIRLERHRIRSGEQTIRITVPREPAWAGIDPFRKLIDRNRRNNVDRVVPTASGGGVGSG